MAIDKAIDSAALEADLTTVADAIRERAGTSALLTFPDGMAAAIAEMSVGEDIGEINGEIDGLTTTSFEIPAGNTTGGTVRLTDDIENAIDEISGVENAVLPDGYTQVEYIQSSGTQYIDTGFMANQDTRVVVDYADESASGNLALFGGRSGTSSLAFALWRSSTAIYPQYGSVGYNANGSIEVDVSTRFVADMNKNVLSANGTSLTCTEQTFQCAYNLFLFGLNVAGSVDSRMVSGKLYSCQIYDNGTLVRDFVPCVNSSGVAGLYDIVNGVFYADAAGGTFEAGGEVPVKYGSGVSASLDALEAVSDDISTALTERGVEVPSEMQLDDVAGLIGEIDKGVQVATGTVTLSDYTTQTTTVDGLGFTPKRVFILGLYHCQSYSKKGHLVALDTGVAAGDAGLSAPIREWGANVYDSTYNVYIAKGTTSDNYTTVQMADGEFTVTTTKIYTSSSTNYTCYLPKYFNYIAIG